MPGSEEEDILFLHLAVVFKMKNERKRMNIVYQNCIEQFNKKWK